MAGILEMSWMIVEYTDVIHYGVDGCGTVLASTLTFGRRRLANVVAIVDCYRAQLVIGL